MLFNFDPNYFLYDFQIKLSLNFIPMGTIDNNSAFICVMVWHLIGTKSLHEQMLNHCQPYI